MFSLNVYCKYLYFQKHHQNSQIFAARGRRSENWAECSDQLLCGAQCLQIIAKMDQNKNVAKMKSEM